MPPEFVKLRTYLQNFVQGFQNSEFYGYSKFSKFLEAKKVTSHGQVLKILAKEHEIS